MRKISQIVIKVIIIILTVQTLCMTSCQAGFWGDIFNAGDNFLDEGKNASNNMYNANSEELLQKEFNNVYNILFTIGVGLTVIIGAVLGIKFIIGTVEEQAKIKEMLFPYIVGCIVIFGAFSIWKLIITIMANI